MIGAVMVKAKYLLLISGDVSAWKKTRKYFGVKPEPKTQAHKTKVKLQDGSRIGKRKKLNKLESG